jgi:hypothetical protein
MGTTRKMRKMPDSSTSQGQGFKFSIDDDKIDWKIVFPRRYFPNRRTRD